MKRILYLALVGMAAAQFTQAAIFRSVITVENEGNEIWYGSGFFLSELSFTFLSTWAIDDSSWHPDDALRWGNVEVDGIGFFRPPYDFLFLSARARLFDGTALTSHRGQVEVGGAASFAAVGYFLMEDGSELIASGQRFEDFADLFVTHESGTALGVDGPLSLRSIDSVYVKIPDATQTFSMCGLAFVILAVAKKRATLSV